MGRRGSAGVNRAQLLLFVCVATLLLAGCYSLRPSNGGGQTKFTPPRAIDVQDVAVPTGYRIEAVATGLTFPTALVFDDANRAYVVEAGYSYGEAFTVPRLLRLEDGNRTTKIARSDTGPWTGASFHGGRFYIAESGTPGRVLAIDPIGKQHVVVDNLPARTNHFTDRPVMGPNGWLYFGQGTATNAGIVGEDNLHMGWLQREPAAHDIPCRDVALAGENIDDNALNDIVAWLKAARRGQAPSQQAQATP